MCRASCSSLATGVGSYTLRHTTVSRRDRSPPRECSRKHAATPRQAKGGSAPSLAGLDTPSGPPGPPRFALQRSDAGPEGGPAKSAAAALSVHSRVAGARARFSSAREPRLRRQAGAVQRPLGGSGVVCVGQNTGWRRLAHGASGRSETAVAEVARGTIRWGRGSADVRAQATDGAVGQAARAYGEGGAGRRTPRRPHRASGAVSGASRPSGAPGTS